jgi:hypothetical protein
MATLPKGKTPASHWVDELRFNDWEGSSEISLGEQMERRHQTCLVFVRQEKTDGFGIFFGDLNRK